VGASPERRLIDQSDDQSYQPRGRLIIKGQPQDLKAQCSEACFREDAGLMHGRFERLSNDDMNAATARVHGLTVEAKERD